MSRCWPMFWGLAYLYIFESQTSAQKMAAPPFAIFEGWEPQTQAQPFYFYFPTQTASVFFPQPSTKRNPDPVTHNLYSIAQNVPPWNRACNSPDIRRHFRLRSNRPNSCH